jgi:iron complex outermembrane recepter protein
LGGIVSNKCAPVVCALTAALIASQSVHAQTASTGSDQIEEIVVTAQKRDQNLQKIPISVTAVSGETLEAQGITDVSSFARTTSGLQLGQGTAGVVVPFLRGVGTSATNLGAESSVAVYADGVYFSRLPAGFFSLSDVERVEVLKGPQGTLFGRNSSAGVIQIITKDPSQTPMVKGSVSYGDYDTVESSLYATTGINDKAAADVAVSYRHQGDGYGRDITTGNRANYNDDLTVRSKLLVEPWDATRITAGGYFAHSTVGLQGNTYPGTIQGYSSAPLAPLPTLGFYDQRNDSDSLARSSSWGAYIKLQHDFGVAQFNSISAYSHENEFLQADGDYTERPDFLVLVDGHGNQTTQEFQLLAPKDSALNWIAGFFYYNALTVFDNDKLLTPSGALAAAFGPGLTAGAEQRARSTAGYAQATYEVLPKLNLTGGLRYTHDIVEANGYVALNFPTPAIIYQPGSASSPTSKTTYKAALDYQLTDAVLAYLSVSQGYKSNSFNLQTYDPVANRPEVLNAYELGIKSDLLNRRLRVNSSIFLYNINSPQVQLYENSTNVTSNAGGARVKGAEIEAEAVVAEGLNARFGATVLDSKYTSYGTVGADGTIIGGAPSGRQNFSPPYGALPLTPVDATGNYTPQAPKFTLSTGLNYAMSTAVGAFLFDVNYYYNSGFYWEPDDFLHQKSYGLLDARVKYRPTDKFAVAVWGKNLIDEHYASQALTQAGPAGYPYIAAPPLTFGVSFEFKL